jgi:hypothetical protein
MAGKRKAETPKEALTGLKKLISTNTSDSDDSCASETVRVNDIAVNLFGKGGLIFEDYATNGCTAEDCIKHMFCSVCCPCNHDFLDDYEIRTHSLRIAADHFKKHQKCGGFGGGPLQGGFHYCKILRDGKHKMKFPNLEGEYFEDEDDEDWDGKPHGVWFETAN